MSKIRKGDTVIYRHYDGRQFNLPVVRVHRDGTLTLSAPNDPLSEGRPLLHVHLSELVKPLPEDFDPNTCETCGSQQCVSFRGADCPEVEKMWERLRKEQVATAEKKLSKHGWRNVYAEGFYRFHELRRRGNVFIVSCDRHGVIEAISGSR